MVLTAKLELPDFDAPIDLETFEWGIKQSHWQGNAQGKVNISTLSIRVKGVNNLNFFHAWAKESNKMQSGKITYLMEEGQIAHTLRFEKARCKSCLPIFDRNGDDSGFCDVELAVAFENYTLDDDTKEKENEEAPVTPVEEKKEGDLVTYYLEDTEGNQIKKYDVGDTIVLVIETKDIIGENLTITIADKEADFEHQGERLENDTLEHTVQEEIDRVELKVIEEQQEA